jgi:hypothetical protein
MRRSKRGRKAEQGVPLEIPMTDLGGAEEVTEGDDATRAAGDDDIHAAGTPGGGTASGGLAGTNAGDGSPDDVNLENPMGSGVLDQGGEEDDDGPPYAGPAGGSVGGTPAEGRASGGRAGRGIAPGGTHRGDSTIGSKS